MRGWATATSGAGRFLHIPRGQGVGVIPVRGEPWCYVGHWADGAMRPCRAEECLLCQAGVGTQVRLVLEVVRVPGWEVRVWEFGRGVGSRLREAAGGVEDVAGLGFRVVRQGAGRGQLVPEYAPELEAVALAHYGGNPSWWQDLRGELDAEAVLREWWNAQGWV